MERWICRNCNKKWIFPVKKCVYCKGDIEIEKSTKLKVVGFTKVFIPSPLHPIIPYNILILEDEHGNRMPKKTMKDYQIGDVYEDEIATEDNGVSIVKIKYDFYEAVEHAIELINGLNVNDSTKVLIKPNIEASAYPYLSLNTNPEVLDAIIKYLIAQKVQRENITVAEQVFAGSFDENAKRSGIAEVCRKNNVKLGDLAKGEFVRRELNNRSFEISKIVFSNDVIINVPVMKTNVQLGISGPLENMQRVVNIETHLGVCNAGIIENMVLLNKLLPKYITIGDASIGIQGQGPLQLGESAFLNLILASNDPVALEKVFCEIGMLHVPEYLNLATKENLGISRLQDIKVVGEDINAIKFELKKPEQPFKVHPNITVYDGKSCSLCFNAVMELQKLTGVSGYDINLVMGHELNKELLYDKERLVAFGDFAIEKLAEFGITPIAELKGHPPNTQESLLLIKKLIEDKDAKLSAVDTIVAKFAAKAKGLFK